MYVYRLPVTCGVHVHHTLSSLKVAETLHNEINIVQLVGSEICMDCDVKYARLLC
jgi:hypothetical protein